MGGWWRGRKYSITTQGENAFALMSGELSSIHISGISRQSSQTSVNELEWRVLLCVFQIAHDAVRLSC